MDNFYSNMRGHARTGRQLQDIVDLYRCVDDPVFFAESTLIRSPRGESRGQLYPHQRVMLRHLRDNPQTLILKARQIGATETLAAHALWFASFKADSTILVMGSKLAHSIDLLDRIRFRHHHTPSYLRSELVGDAKTSLDFDNNARIIARAPSADACRGLVLSLVLMDEAAYVADSKLRDYFERQWPVMVASGTQTVIMTTAGTSNTMLYDLWHKAAIGDGPLTTMTVDYTVSNGDPNSYRSRCGERAFLQEYACQFVPPR
jgi:hypothetical protein